MLQPKRIVILVIASTNQSVYTHYINTYWTNLINYTNSQCSNVDVFLLFQNGTEVSQFDTICSNIIIDQNKDFNDYFGPNDAIQIIPGVLSKLIYAYELFQDKYDVFFKTNLNCMIHIEKFEEFVQNKEKIIYSGASVWHESLREDLIFHNLIGPDKTIKSLEELNHYGGNTFVSGPAIFMSKEEVKNLITRKSDLRYDLIEDVSIGLMMSEYESLIDFTLDISSEEEVVDIIDKMIHDEFCHVRLEHFPLAKAQELWHTLEQLKLELLLNTELLKKEVFQDVSIATINNKPPYTLLNSARLDIALRVNFLTDILSALGPVEKRIHISWKNNDILDKDYNIIKYGILQLKQLNPDYTFEISTDAQVEAYIGAHIEESDYDLIKNKHIVEKIDLWRLLKIFNEGGIYMDLDRFCNLSMKDVLNQGIKCILPMHYDIDFAQDVMISCSKNPIHRRAIDLNLKRRRSGCTDVLSLGPITYFNAVTEVLLGYQIDRYPDKEHLELLRTIVHECCFLDSYKEEPMTNTIFYRGPDMENDIGEFYSDQHVEHWAGIESNHTEEKPFGP